MVKKEVQIKLKNGHGGGEKYGITKKEHNDDDDE
jgi:hypothetical protein